MILTLSLLLIYGRDGTVDEDDMPLKYASSKKYCCDDHYRHLHELKERTFNQLKESAELQLMSAIDREAVKVGRDEFISRSVLLAIADRLQLFHELPSSVKLAALDQSMVGHQCDARLFAKRMAAEYSDLMKTDFGLEK